MKRRSAPVDAPFSGGGVTVDVVAIGSCRRTLFGRGLVADEVTIGSYREGPTADVVMIGSCKSCQPTKVSAGIAGFSGVIRIGS
jgi:hypothetical protein